MCEDDKLGKLLDPALINILNFLGSQSATVKTKAMGILSHLNKRAPAVARVPVHLHAAPLPPLSIAHSFVLSGLKANVAVPLPLPGLIRTFTAPTAVPMVSNFALVYIEMGLPRVSAAERAALVPALLVGVGQRPAAQQVRRPDDL